MIAAAAVEVAEVVGLAEVVDLAEAVDLVVMVASQKRIFARCE